MVSCSRCSSVSLITYWRAQSLLENYLYFYNIFLMFLHICMSTKYLSTGAHVDTFKYMCTLGREAKHRY